MLEERSRDRTLKFLREHRSSLYMISDIRDYRVTVSSNLCLYNLRARRFTKRSRRRTEDDRREEGVLQEIPKYLF